LSSKQESRWFSRKVKYFTLRFFCSVVTENKKPGLLAGKEATWHLDKVVGMAEVSERCTRRHAQSVRKNAKSLLNQAETVLYTARNAFRSAEIVAVNK